MWTMEGLGLGARVSREGQTEAGLGERRRGRERGQALGELERLLLLNWGHKVIIISQSFINFLVLLIIN